MMKSISVSITAVLLGALTLGAAPSDAKSPTKSTSSRPSAAAKKSQKLQLLRDKELAKLPAAKRIQYFRTLQALVTTLEKSGNNQKGPRKKALMQLLIPYADAAQAGEPCLNGGYLSTWQPRDNGRLSCAAPTDQLWDGPNESKEFFCGQTPSGERMAYCSSGVFLYANDAGDRFCQPISNLSANCANAFNERYGAGKDPTYPNRLAQAYRLLTERWNLDTYYTEFEAHLNDVIAAGGQDKATAEILRNQISTLNGIKAFASQLPVPNPASSPTGTPPPTETPAPSTTPGSGDTLGGGSLPADPGGDVLDITPPAGSATPPPATSATAATPAPTATPTPSPESNLLGRELSCVRDGLTALGHKPSEKFLALVGIGAQAFTGPYRTEDESQRKALQARVISTIQSYGFCDESVYPSGQTDVEAIRRWLTADHGAVTGDQGHRYFARASNAGGRLTEDKLFAVFGIQQAVRSEQNSGVIPAIGTLFGMSRSTWDGKNLLQRQLNFTSWEPNPDRVNRGSFVACHNNAVQRTRSDSAFNLGLFTQENRATAVNDPSLREKLNRIASENRKTCQSMATACGLDVAATCNTGAVADGYNYRDQPGSGTVTPRGMERPERRPQPRPNNRPKKPPGQLPNAVST